MENKNDERVGFRPYDPRQDRFLYRGIAILIGVVSILCITAAIVLALYDHHDIALAIMGIGSAGFGALITFFTQQQNSR